ncbi:MAG: beta-phosphoglucomutase family hydrolase [Saccharospirillum sp.]
MFDVSPYEGLIFDMDGTLVESGPLHEKAWTQTLTHFNLPVIPSLMRSLAGVPTRDTIDIIAEQTGQPLSASLDAINDYKEALVQSLAADYVRPTRLAELAQSQAGIKPMAVGTGAYTEEAERILQHCQLRPLLHAVVGADRVDRPKPAPDTFLLCAQLMGVAPEECVVFEDADLGLTAAKAAGMTAIDVRTEFSFVNVYFLED